MRQILVQMQLKHKDLGEDGGGLLNLQLKIKINVYF